MILFYLIFFVLAVSLAVVLFRRLRSVGVIRAIVLTLLALCAFGLFFPIPIHGGFTFPLEILYGELQQEKWRQEEGRAEERKRVFELSSVQRFDNVFTGYERLSEGGGWQEVLLPHGVTAWLDLDSRLFWLPPQRLENTVTALDLEQAMAFCRRQSPQGYWALPTEGEMALLWQHGGQHIMPGTGHSSAAVLLQGELQLQLLTQYRGKIPGFTLRCVALSTSAPRRGYTASDIPLSLWNEYQLNKADIYSTMGKTDGTPLSQEIK